MIDTSFPDEQLSKLLRGELSHSTTSTHFLSSIVLYVIENVLRELSVEAMSLAFGPQWYKSQLSPTASQKYLNGINYDRASFPHSFTSYHPIYYLDFPDLRELISKRDNWRLVFGNIFGNKYATLITSKMAQLEPVRNKIAHNRLVTISEFRLLRSFYDDLRLSIGDYRFSALLTRTNHTHAVFTTFRNFSRDDGGVAVEYFERKRAQIEGAGGALRFELADMCRVPVHELLSRLVKSGNVRLRNRIAHAHARELVDYYTGKRDIESAEFHANCLEAIRGQLEGWEINNVGYLMLKLGRYEGALLVLNQALDADEKEAENRLLPLYNLAVAQASLGDFNRARELLDICITEGKNLPRKRRQVICLFVIIGVVGGEVSLEEVWDKPDIWICAKKSREVIAHE